MMPLRDVEMSRGKRLLIVVGALAGVVVLGWVLLIGAVYAWGGVVTVQIRDTEEGLNLYLPVPVALVDVAVATGRQVVSYCEIDELLEVQADLREWQPFLGALLEALDESPDFTLVEVEDGTAHVRVVKKGRSLIIEVSESDLSLRVSLPTRALKRTVGRLVA